MFYSQNGPRILHIYRLVSYIQEKVQKPMFAIRQKNSYLLRSSEIARIQERRFVLNEGDITSFLRKYREQSSSMGDFSIIGGHAPPPHPPGSPPLLESDSGRLTNAVLSLYRICTNQKSAFMLVTEVFNGCIS